jgi:LemA protein
VLRQIELVIEYEGDSRYHSGTGSCGVALGRGGGAMDALAIAAVLALILGLVALWGVVTYNRLVRLRNLRGEAWSGIDVQLKRRHDLIPNLADVVREYTEHERDLFPRVAELRSRAVRAVGPLQQSQAENALTGLLRNLLAVVEDYPELQASQNFLDLQRNLSEAEDQIQLARRYYNGTVRNLNNAVQSFPTMIVAAAAGFGPEEFFEIEFATERRAPELHPDGEGRDE